MEIQMEVVAQKKTQRASKYFLPFKLDSSPFLFMNQKQNYSYSNCHRNILPATELSTERQYNLVN